MNLDSKKLLINYKSSYIERGQVLRCMGSMWDANQLAFPLILSLVNQNFKKETNFLSLNSTF